MTLEEAYIMRKQECKTLQRENSKLLETIEQLRKGAYSDPDKIEHIRQISELTREIQKSHFLKSVQFHSDSFHSVKRGRLRK